MQRNTEKCRELKRNVEKYRDMQRYPQDLHESWPFWPLWHTEMSYLISLTPLHLENIRQHCRLTIRRLVVFVKIQITIWWWDGQACLGNMAHVASYRNLENLVEFWRNVCMLGWSIGQCNSCKSISWSVVDQDKH